MISVTALVLLSLCGAVSAAGLAWSYVQRWRKPGRDLAGKVDAQAKMLDNDNRRIGELQEGNRLVIRGLMQLMEHEIDGNHVDRLREARDEMQQYLIDR